MKNAQKTDYLKHISSI